MAQLSKSYTPTGVDFSPRCSKRWQVSTTAHHLWASLVNLSTMEDADEGSPISWVLLPLPFPCRSVIPFNFHLFLLSELYPWFLFVCDEEDEEIITYIKKEATCLLTTSINTTCLVTFILHVSFGWLVKRSVIGTSKRGQFEPFWRLEGQIWSGKKFRGNHDPRQKLPGHIWSFTQ